MWLKASRTVSLSVALGVALSAAGCDDSNPVDFPSGPSAAPRTAAVSIRSDGFQPSLTFVRPGGEVTFTNADNVAHQVASDPHPSHSQLPDLSGSVLAPGEAQTVRMPETRRDWTYHDDTKLLAPGFQGTIRVCPEVSLLGC